MVVSISNFVSAAVIAGFLAVGVSQGVEWGPEPTKIVSTNLVQPVGIIESALKANPTRFPMHGSGVFITPTRFLTAGHIVQDMVGDKTITHIRMENGDFYNVIDTALSPDFDLAYVDVDRPYKGFIPKISCNGEERGTVLTNVGSPLALEFVQTNLSVAGGEIARRVEQNKGLDILPPMGAKPKKQKFIRHQPDKNGKPIVKEEDEKAEVNTRGAELVQGPILTGQSGSPLYNKDGDIVGVVIVTVLDPTTVSYTGLGLYVTTKAACGFLSEATKTA